MRNWLPALRALALLGLLASLVFTCEKDYLTENRDESSSDPQKESFELAQTWNEVQLDVERFTKGYRSPVAARTLAYTGLAAYEAIVNGMPKKYNSFDGYFKGLDIPEPNTKEAYHWPTVLNAAYGRSIIHFYPYAPAAQLFKVYSIEQDFNEKFRAEVSSATYSRSVDYGRLVADAVFNWSRSDKEGDGAFLRNSDPAYAPPSGAGKWQPTFPDYAPALLPYWGKVRTFVADATDKCPEPLAYSTDPNSEIYKQALEPFKLANDIRAGRAETEQWVADFWCDDCPSLTFTSAGRFIAIANQLVEKEQMDLGAAVELYARIGMGLCDAGIRAWHQKYTYNYLRPVDYIRKTVPNGTNWNTAMCPDGTGKYFTPPFPTYPSDHATFGAVAAEIFSSILGEKYSFTDRSHEGRTEFKGQARTFTDFRKMAEENAFSRLSSGVDFRMDATAGLALGYGIGKKVNKLPWRK